MQSLACNEEYNCEKGERATKLCDRQSLTLKIIKKSILDSNVCTGKMDA